MNAPPLPGLFERLAADHAPHVNGSAAYAALDAACATAIAASGFADPEGPPVALPPYGELRLPYREMGAISSTKLFGLDELIIFAFYAANRARYRSAVDIGANLGLHSMLMARLGWQVTAYEPDPQHMAWLGDHLTMNAITGVAPVRAAVSDHEGAAEFVRVKGNTTGSHLAGAKADPYGALDRFEVAVHAASRVLATCDFAKIDAEGHEVAILRAVPAARWATLDAMIEVGTPANAAALFAHFAALPVKLFAQQRGWAPVAGLHDMPTSHREGSLFISAKGAMPWGSA
jgi:FkbM family methyltransferase